MRRIEHLIGAVLAVLAACGTCEARSSLPAWSDRHYAKFNLARFSGYRPARREIDFANIDYDLLGAVIFYETNRARVKRHRRPLVYSAALRAAAFGHAKDMAEKDFHSHVNPDDPKKKTIQQRLARVGLKGCVMSENIAFVPGRPYPIVLRKPSSGQIQIDPSNPPAPHTYLSFARQLVDGWMLSPGHKKNILSNATGYLGCAAYYCEKKMLTSRGDEIGVDYFKACQNFASTRGPNPR